MSDAPAPVEVEAPVETPAPVEVPAEVPVEVEVPAETPVETPAEVYIHKPYRALHAGLSQLHAWWKHHA